MPKIHTMSATTPEPRVVTAAAADDQRAQEIRERHALAPGLRARLRDADPQRAHQAYLEEQLALTERLAGAMAAATGAEALAGHVVRELQATLGTYFVAIGRIDDGEILRIIAGAGLLAEDEGRFIISEFPANRGVAGRVVRTGRTALVPDTRVDPDYISRNRTTDPCSQLTVPISVEGRIWGVLNLEEADPGAFDETDATLMRVVAGQLGVALHRIAIYQELERALVTTLTVLGAAMEVRDAYTALHEEAVAELAASIAAHMGLDPNEQRAIRYAALTHDLGKLSVPTEILQKPGPLDDHEWSIMRRHTVVGAEMLARIPFFEGVVSLVRGHHERWDGAGYPDGLAGGTIPIGARILCVCDSYNAMTTNRPYRSALSVQAALQELRRCTGSQFDPQVVAALEHVLDRRAARR
jgi:putative nucleotidyltransferase with HDIG domain